MSQEVENQQYVSAQSSLVSTLLYDDSMVKRVLELTSPEDFDDPKFELIMEAIASIARRDERVSLKTVARELESWGKLSNVGGGEELYSLYIQGERDLLEASPELYASIVKELSAKKQVRVLLNESRKGFNEDTGTSASNGIAEIQTELNQISYKLRDDSTITNVAKYMPDYFQLLDERLEISVENEERADGLQGIPFSLPTLNRYTGGWSPQQLITVGARTGVGKSVFAVMAVVSAARAGNSVLFFSLEMSHQEIVDRLVANMSGVSMGRLKTGRLSKEDRELIGKAREELETFNIQIDTDPRTTIDTIRSKCFNQAQSPEGLDLVVVDYLQLLTPVGKFNSRQEQVADLSRNVKLLAKTLNVPIMVLVQLNRIKNDDDDDKTPTLDHIRESGAIAMDSDIVVLLHRDTTQEEATPLTKVILEKNRNGETNKTILCHSNLECSAFREIRREKDVKSDTLTDEELMDADIDTSDYEDDDDIIFEDDSDNDFIVDF